MQICTPAGQSSDAGVRSPSDPTAQPALFLSAHVHLCEFDDGAVILDLRRDSYVGIDAQHLANLRNRIGNWPDSDRTGQKLGRHEISVSVNLIADLLSRGILTTSPTPRQSRPAANATGALTVPSSSQELQRIRLPHIAQFFIAFMVVVLLLRRNRLPMLLDWLRRRQAVIHRGYSVTREEVMTRLTSFLWLRALCYTAQRRCLFDSLVLSVYLTREKIPCTFVIGVAIKPFLAHSWVQIDESVLNDTAERVQDFKPILSVG
jgi:hypothetical protein